MDPHAVLGIDKSASLAKVKARYKTLARELHPDKHTEKFCDLQTAYKTLTKPPPEPQRVPQNHPFFPNMVFVSRIVRDVELTFFESFYGKQLVVGVNGVRAHIVVKPGTRTNDQ